MKRTLALLSLATLMAAGVSLAQDKKVSLKTAVGTVKTVAADMVTMTDKADKEWSFAVDMTTKVIAKGASHKAADAKEAGQVVAITDLLKDGQRVRVRYSEMEGKLRAAEIRAI